ncbi:hypothetical protein SteCoe_18964 [Stentor coeruleus]|uniref:Uncharacterized protein n=1 Tax=Stentor coeruleus TaxID=5963 RepID=A0A1R2BV79_9CILI|nr:hypothetical protein SteCoe_18964 [Stentor coeruleus]
MLKSDSKSKLYKFELNFFEVLLELSKKKVLYLGIPETFISGFNTDGISLLCTNYETGELLVKHNISRQTFLDSINFFEDLVKMKSKYPIAVSKISGSSGKDTSKILFRSFECIDLWNRLQGAGKDQILQRYIPSSWNVSIYRCFYDASKGYCRKMSLKKTNKNVYEHPTLKKSIFSNVVLAKIDPELDRNSYIIKKMDQVSCTLVNDMPELDIKMQYLANLLEKYYFSDKYSKLLSLSADWIQDPKGNLFLINLKNYQIRSGHTNLLIDRPLKIQEKQKHQCSYTEILLRRSLSPPFYYPIQSLNSLKPKHKRANSNIILPNVSSKKFLSLT